MSPIANLLVQLKNAQLRGKHEIDVPFSALKKSILEILKTGGYIDEVASVKKKSKKSEIQYLRVKIKNNAINGIKLVSKPSRRMYYGKDEIKKVKSGYGISIVSTSKGIMTGEDAKKSGVGGELLFEIW